MVFSSSIFLFFFLPIVLLLYYLVRTEFRNVTLLIASLMFYAWGEPEFVFVIIASILINYLFGLLIHVCHAKSKTAAKVVMLAGVAANCGLLFYFKYYDFFLTSVHDLTGWDVAIKNIVLPIGISFFTFQGLSYVIDVYLKKVEIQRNLINFAMYKAFFPQLIAGPIVRYVDIHYQIERRSHSVDKFAEGVRRFIIGLSKKVLIANSLGQVADNIFGLPADQSSTATLWVGAICYSFQIYFDFSGYSDMAIGLAKMFGFDFKENFNYPYIAKSISDFWRRWHISLSSWFRDYLYIPLGGNRTGNVYVNLTIVFIVTGLWHGAAWNFVLWGLWHGLFQIIERVLKKSEKVKIRIPSFLQWLYTMMVVLIGWVLFRAPDLNYALKYLGGMFGFVSSRDVGFTVWYYLDQMAITMILIGCLASLPIVPYLRKIVGPLEEHNGFSLFWQTVYIAALLVICMMFLATSTYNPFIYFRF
jgi:Predicted membrane protein involved in D-alanine export